MVPGEDQLQVHRNPLEVEIVRQQDEEHRQEEHEPQEPQQILRRRIAPPQYPPPPAPVQQYFEIHQPLLVAQHELARQEPVRGKWERRRYDKEQRGIAKDSYNALKQRVKTLSGPLSEAEMTQVQSMMASQWAQNDLMQRRAGSFTQGEVFEQINTGNYANFEQLDPVFRCYFASRYMRRDFRPPADNQTAQEYVAAIKQASGMSGLMHPLFRLGVSLCLNGGGFGNLPPEYFRAIDTACGTEIMVETLTKQPSQDDLDRLVEQRLNTRGNKRTENQIRQAVQADRIRNIGSQIYMAKTLLMTQMSGFNKMLAGGGSEPWNMDVSAAFTHCSRVSFILPSVKTDEGWEEAAHETMWKSYRELSDQNFGDGIGHGNVGQIFRRGGSTHNLTRRGVNSAFKEKKALMNFFGQEGMNVSVGGFGNLGIPGAQARALDNDGTCGHIYTMRKMGTASLNGGMLVGFESDAHTKTNQLGHTHGMGNPEYASSFGGQRTDEIGLKYGGRIADLGNQFSPVQIAEHMQILEEFMRRSIAEGFDISGEMRQLAGAKMNRQQLRQFMSDLNSRIRDIKSTDFI